MSEMDRVMDRLPDTEINAYLDGELDQQGLTEVEAWLAEHPEDAARVHAYKLQKLHLHRLYDLPKDEPLPDSVRAVLSSTRTGRWLPGWRQLAAGVMLLVVGGMGGWFGDKFVVQTQPTAGTAFVHRALQAYNVYAYEASRPVEVGVQDKNDLVGWLSDRLGQQLRTPDLAAAGFSLIGGRLVADQNEPAALFMYEDVNNRRVTLYVRRGRGMLDTELGSVVSGSSLALYWTDHALDYALAGELPRAELMKLARIVSQEIEAKAST